MAHRTPGNRTACCHSCGLDSNNALRGLMEVDQPCSILDRFLSSFALSGLLPRVPHVGAVTRFASRGTRARRTGKTLREQRGNGLQHKAFPLFYLQFDLSSPPTHFWHHSKNLSQCCLAQLVTCFYKQKHAKKLQRRCKFK